MITLTTDYPDYFPVMESADDETLRKEMYFLAQTVAYPSNEAVFANLLKARKKLANLLGYKNWPEYSQSKLMIGNPDNAEKFVKKIAAMSMPYAKKEAEVLLAKKKAVLGREDVEIEPWDRFYYPRLVRMEKFNYDPEAVRPYFEIQKVLNGIFTVNSKIFGLEFKQIKRDDVWHESILSYDVYSNGEKIGTFDLDQGNVAGTFVRSQEITRNIVIKNLGNAVFQFRRPDDFPFFDIDHRKLAVENVRDKKFRLVCIENHRIRLFFCFENVGVVTVRGIFVFKSV